jgi:hypothetical protein
MLELRRAFNDCIRQQRRSCVRSSARTHRPECLPLHQSFITNIHQRVQLISVCPLELTCSNAYYFVCVLLLFAITVYHFICILEITFIIAYKLMCQLELRIINVHVHYEHKWHAASFLIGTCRTWV